jgi:hypothetical protein
MDSDTQIYDVDRLYVPEKYRRRGLMQLEKACVVEIKCIMRYSGFPVISLLLKKNEIFLAICC